jgi:hypothetical protein
MPRPKLIDIFVEASTNTLSKQNPAFQNIDTSSNDDNSFHTISFTLHGEALVQRKHLYGTTNSSESLNCFINTARLCLIPDNLKMDLKKTDKE